MELTIREKKMFKGEQGNAVKKSMEILVALGEIFGAGRLIPVSSVQIAGVSYHNLGEAGLEYLNEIAKDGKVKVLTTLNPAGMDLENWKSLGISEQFAEKQERVIEAFRKMGAIASCTCTPYLIGNLPLFNQHLAWSESSAVCFANSIIGAKTNKEGGPSAIASALTGRTPEFGLHLDSNRQAEILVEVKTGIKKISDFGALGYVIGNKIKNKIPLIKGTTEASLEQLKSFCASIATYGGISLFHMEGITPNKTIIPKETIDISGDEIEEAKSLINEEIDSDLIGIGCPHASINEIAQIADLLSGKKVKKEFWICTARSIKNISDMMGYTKIIEKTGAKFACDTCMAVAPLKGRFKGLTTNSAKAAYYCRGTNKLKINFYDLEDCIKYAIGEK